MERAEDGMSEEAFDLEEALSAEPGSAGSVRLEAWLRGLDDARWRELLRALRTLSGEVAPRYRDVVEPDDALGELAVLTVDRWLPRYLDELRKGEARASLWAFLKLRFAGHLSELRRKRRRRATLLEEHVGPRPGAVEADEVPVAEAMMVGAASDPHEEAFADELMRKAGRDPGLRAILALRYAGFTQEEIAKLLSLSRPTVSRRLAVLGSVVTALLVAVLAAALVLFGWVRPEAPTAPAIEADERLAPMPVPAGGWEPPPPPPAPEPPPLPRTLTGEQIARVVRDNRETVQACWATHLRRVGDARTTRLDVAVRISPDGQAASEAPLGTGGESLTRCIAEAVSRWEFPPAAEPTRSVIPFVFQGTEGPAEPVEAPTTDADLDAELLACNMAGDNECIIRLLEGRARTQTQLASLIEAYRARGQTSRALGHMRTFVQRFPGTPRAQAYQQILRRHP